MVLASAGSAFAAAMASRSEQLLGVQVAWVSAVLVTVKLAARTSLPWSRPSAASSAAGRLHAHEASRPPCPPAPWNPGHALAAEDLRHRSDVRHGGRWPFGR